MKISTTQVLLGLVLLTGIVMANNSYQLSNLGVSISQSGTSEINLLGSYEVPKGTPDTYGAELGVSFDDVDPYDPVRANAVIEKLSNLDRTITLEGSNKARYINALYTLENGISCEYCCGARSIIFENGEPACGCAHSYAMRGLAKYIITEHGDEFTDRQILEEIGKWKALFFPNQIANKAQIMEENSLETDMVSLTSNKYRGVEKQAAGGSTGGMVGGC